MWRGRYNGLIFTTSVWSIGKFMGMSASQLGFDSHQCPGRPPTLLFNLSESSFLEKQKATVA
jgi:hypothetical protein